MEPIDIILIILCVVTTIGFGTIFIIVVRRILEDGNTRTENHLKERASAQEKYLGTISDSTVSHVPCLFRTNPQ